jgi:hypothetical protein
VFVWQTLAQDQHQGEMCQLAAQGLLGMLVQGLQARLLAPCGGNVPAAAGRQCHAEQLALTVVA